MSRRPERKIPVVFVGKKPASFYIRTITDILGIAGRATVKARGRYISKAIGVCEMAGKFMRINYRRIDIGSEELESDSGDKKYVPSIVIELEKS